MNVEGLKRHSLLLVMFVPEPAVSLKEVRLRSWLLHTLASAARQYIRARELVQLQEQAHQVADGGAVLYLLDVSEQLEGCVMALNRVLSALGRMQSSDPQAKNGSLDDAFERLKGLRNQFEHMHSQIVPGETGNGPISIVFSGEGKWIRFRDKRVETSKLCHLLHAAFLQVCALYPSFDSKSLPEPGGPPKLTISATIEVISGNHAESEASNSSGDA
ncbi:MAG: hypothetical protein EAZ24_13035 [Burkholderiales bacterium]|nr:MAG: hypothetical protein EAZ24_13035 [Burkholderiales bacterium]TAG78585.1 MAG: hypothetical protein EAZ21_12365 [Betaproteobacteria bacterium]